jgi:peptide/nickel transport system substrate-binding protein
MNTRKGLLTDTAVRLAIAEAIDRAIITESAVTPITGEVTEPLQSLVWPMSHQDNARPFAEFDGDRAAAEAILQDAGWELGDQGARFRDGEILEIQLLYAEGSSLAEQALAQALVVQLLDAGIRVVASVKDPDELFGARSTGDYDMVIALDVVNTDPVAAVFRFGSSYCPSGFGVPGCDSAIPLNFTGVSDDVLDELLVETGTESDPNRRTQLFVDIDRRLAELMPALPLYELPTFVAHTDRMAGVVVETHRGGPFDLLTEWGFESVIELD